MAATRRDRPIGAGRIDIAKVDAMTEDDTRRFLIEDGLDPDNPLAGFQPVMAVPATAIHAEGDRNQVELPGCPAQGRA